MRFLPTLLLCLVGLFPALIIVLNEWRWRTGDKRHASFRTIVVSVVILLGLSVFAHARPSSSSAVTSFNGDRYAGQAVTAAPARSFVSGLRREVGRATGRPRAWCGWWLGHHLGMPLRSLWLARNWAFVGSNAGGPAPGVVVVWRHHVGIITGRQGSQWIIKSGNDGHAVRERARSVAGAIAFRMIGGRG